jgi:hypothetical protein
MIQSSTDCVVLGDDTANDAVFEFYPHHTGAHSTSMPPGMQGEPAAIRGALSVGRLILPYVHAATPTTCMATAFAVAKISVLFALSYTKHHT